MHGNTNQHTQNPNYFHSILSPIMEYQKLGVTIYNFTLIWFLLSIFSVQYVALATSTGLNQQFNPTDTASKNNERRTYIVHVKQPDTMMISSSGDLENWHKSFLPVSTASLDQPTLVYSYRNVISGFAARLNDDEVKSMRENDGFLQAIPDRLSRLQTTQTPQFLGLKPELGIWRESNFGEGVIIGMLDTGVWPEHPSFEGTGFPSPPPKWKGRCENSTSGNFNSSNCNNKLIGARIFDTGFKAMLGKDVPIPETSARDTEGHGTHTASTAGGRFVGGADVFGNARGTAAGMAPLAHVAIYKVCFNFADCADSDMLAGMDAAVDDGVDVLSVSLGENDPLPFYQDVIALGGFGAIQKGVFVSCAAANFGPLNSTVRNDAPWVLTVGASTIDRSVMAVVKLGSDEAIFGESGFRPTDFEPTLLPLVYPGANDTQAAICANGSLNGVDVRGKVVVCDRGGGVGRIAKGETVRSAGGAAMILVNNEIAAFETDVDAHVLPASHVGFSSGLKIKSYMNSIENPSAAIEFKGTYKGAFPSPMVASFSSRGPSIASPGILKPDIIGPGVSILAGWTMAIGPSVLPNDQRRVLFNFDSGTSMSAPHLSGIAALLKSSHPDWSPAAIKSALMTTADVLDNAGKPICDQTLHPADLFAIGAGHVNPSNANDPGLVYDLQPEDYIPYLCGLGYTDEQVGIIIRRSINCSTVASILEGELNYPSFSIIFQPNVTSMSFPRTVTNVGEPYSYYSLEIDAPEDVKVSVKPHKLSFTKVNQKMTYMVTFKRRYNYMRPHFSQGYLRWVTSDSKFVVGSPISVSFL